MIERYSLPQMNAIWQDEFKFRTMLAIELLSIEAMAKSGTIPSRAASRIRKKARFSVTHIRKIEEKTHHDVVAFVTNVARSLGADAQYLHKGLTSSDLLDTTLGVQLQAASALLIADLQALRRVLARQARKYKDMVCIGRTHGIHAEPTTFGLKLALWYDETNRNVRRLESAAAAVAVGKISGAVGTYAFVSPAVEAYICRKLGLTPAKGATQVVARDIYAEYLTTLALIGTSLEKFSLELRHLQRTEVGEAEEPFAKGQKGSSAMPHKRNPVVCERICGLARILRANAMAGLENVALWHERDISHSSAERVILPDSTLLLDYMLHKFTWVVDGMAVYPEHMLVNLAKTRGLIFSQRALLTLMERGLPRTKAYDIVQRCAMQSWRQDSAFKENLAADRDVRRILSRKDLEKIFTVDYYLRYVNTIFRKIGL